MNELERAAFMANFTEVGRGIGFAVLGGAFGEGIDLPGARLIGAFVATLGLPQINPVNEQVRLRMQATFGAGYDYTYLYPGIQKVVQAAGRVIRSETDRGVLFLIDDRFAQPNVRALLPHWWGLAQGPLNATGSACAGGNRTGRGAASACRMLRKPVEEKLFQAGKPVPSGLLCRELI